jgi:hypothetical protein
LFRNAPRLAPGIVCFLFDSTPMQSGHAFWKPDEVSLGLNPAGVLLSKIPFA